MDNQNIVVTLELDYLEIDADGLGRLRFELPTDMTDEEITYFKTLRPRIQQGSLNLVDPATREIAFTCRPPQVLRPASPFRRYSHGIVDETAIDLDKPQERPMAKTAQMDAQSVANAG